MRKYTIPTSMAVEYFLGDHLGSTSVTADSNGAKISEIKYKPWGEIRSATATPPANTTPAYKLAKYLYTGQFSDSYINLLWYGSRHYDPAIGRFIQPDSIVPLATQGVQAWDRYAYANNNPVRFTDPTGHMIDDGCNTSGCGEWKPKSDIDRRNWAFTKMFLGSGKDGKWTTEDWNYYLDNYNNLWRGFTPWKNPDDETGWDLFALHTKRLSQQYSADQEEQFVKDFALVFAGMSARDHWTVAAWNAADGVTDYYHLEEGNTGLPEVYLDSLEDPASNQSHHYAGLFFLGYYAGGPGGISGNLVRDALTKYNAGDVALGNLAAFHGACLRDPFLRISPLDIANWIDEISP
jgi:RHS repeat-associated protein